MRSAKKNTPAASRRIWGATPAAWATWAALAFSLLSLVVAFLSYETSRTAADNAIRPLVAFDIEDNPDDPTVGIKLINSGPGPALIEDLSYFVDRKPVGDCNSATDAAKLTSDEITDFEYDPDDPMGVGESQWICYRKTADKKELDQFVDFIDKRLAVRVRFCSISGTCWEKCSTRGMCGPLNRH